MISYRIPNDLKYIINPASGLQIQEMLVAVLREGPYSPLGGPAGGFSNIESYNAETDKWIYRTKYVSVGCLSQNIFRIRANSSPGNNNWLPSGNTYIKVMINFIRPGADANTQNVLFVAKYPVIVEGTENIGTVVSCSTRQVPPQSTSAVQTYCTSSAYTSSARFFRYAENLAEIEKEEKLKKQKLFANFINSTAIPNPFVNSTTISYTVAEEGPIKITVTDQLGRVIKELVNDSNHMRGNFTVEFNGTGHKAGLYFYTIEASYYNETKKLVLITN